MTKKIVKAVEETVTETTQELTREANETVGTITFKRWQVALVAVAIVVALLVIVL
jgi:CHASE3 domain sensor protein